MFRHFARTGGAVESHDRHIERLHDGGRRRDIGADQQGAGGFHSDLHENRNLGFVRFRARPLGAVDRRLDLQRILAGLDQESIATAGEQSGRLDGQSIFQGLIIDMTQARQFGARTDIAEHETRSAVGGEFGNHFARQFDRQLVDGEGFVGQAEFAQRDRRTAEGIGRHRVGTRREIAAVNVLHQIGATFIENLGAILLAEIIFIDIEIGGLHKRAHGAIAEQNIIREKIENTFTHNLASCPCGDGSTGAIRKPKIWQMA